VRADRRRDNVDELQYEVCSRTCLNAIRNTRISEMRHQERYRARQNTICMVCGAAFTPPRGDALYCSDACKQKSYRQRRQRPEARPRGSIIIRRPS
jgi:hypothetical protein